VRPGGKRIRHHKKEVRKMKKITVITVVVALALFAGAIVAFSYGPGFGPFGPGAVGRPGFSPGFGPPAFAAGFGPWRSGSGLTSEQSAKFQAIREEALKEVGPLREEFFQKTAELRSLMATENPDKAKISELQKEILALRGKLQEKGTKFRLEAQKTASEQ
jgi:Spy/CpxP family protein refolding chaperone